MTTWASGYVADVPYTHGFYRELTPSFLSFAGLVSGVRVPDPAAKANYCELGCGQGLSANLIAAANPQLNVYANDFNPTHIAGARSLAEDAGLTNVKFYDDSFAEFLAREDLPPFAFIVLHGIYSWVSPERRAEIVEFIRRHLAVGGMVYVSYNALPGWAPGMPLRRLMVEHAARSSGPTLQKVDQAVDFLEALRQSKAGLFATDSSLGTIVDGMKPHDRAYLAHEYFNEDWTPFYHLDVVKEFDAGKVVYFGSASLVDQIDQINLSTDQIALLGTITDRGMKETVRDSMVNTRFRRDLFLRGCLPLSASEQNAAWLDTRFVLSLPRADVPMKFKATIGDISLNPPIYNPVLDALADDAASIRQLLEHEKTKARSVGELKEVLNILTSAGMIQPCLDAAGDAPRIATTAAFNAAVIERAQYSTDIGFVASPLTGGGYALDRVSQLFLGGVQRGEQDVPTYVWNVLDAQGHRLTKDGKLLEFERDTRNELEHQHQQFVDKRLAVLARMGICVI